MGVRALLGILLGAVLVLSGCGASEGRSPGGPAPSAAVAKRVDLSFAAEQLDGSTFDGEQLAGKPAVLWFWAPWCPTCRAQTPEVEKVAKEYAGKVNVVGIGGLADTADIEEYARTVDGPIHLVDAKGAVWRHFGVTAQSTYVVLTEDGTVVGKGYLDNEDLADLVSKLVK